MPYPKRPARICRPEALADAFDSIMTADAPSAATKPLRSRSNGREHCEGNLCFVEWVAPSKLTCARLKASSVESDPPQITMSAIPDSTIMEARATAVVLEAHSVLMVMFGPRAPMISAIIAEVAEGELYTPLRGDLRLRVCLPPLLNAENAF